MLDQLDTEDLAKNFDAADDNQDSGVKDSEENISPAGGEQKQRKSNRGSQQRQGRQRKEMVYKPKATNADQRGKEDTPDQNDEDAGETKEVPKKQVRRNRRDIEEIDGEGEDKEAPKRKRTQSRRRKQNMRDDQIDDDETRPQTARNQRNNRPRKQEGRDRPQTARDGPQGKQMNADQKRREMLQKKRDKMVNQYEPFKIRRVYKTRQAEYLTGEWRQHRNNLFVTIDTIIPPMPEANKILSEPDDAAYHMKVDKINEEIEMLKETIKDKKAEIQERKSKMMDGQQGRYPIKQQLKEHYDELNIYNA